MPAGLLVTVPVPVPALVSVSVKVCTGAVEVPQTSGVYGELPAVLKALTR
jgi:hypothetical protein